MKLIDLNAKSIYVHIPFCSSICAYCDFIKIQYFPFLADNYLSALEKEFLLYSFPEDIETIYVGGGTPTVLNDEQLKRLLEIIKPYTNNVIEYTFESNPETLDERKIKLLKLYGVNRISLGVESTNDKILELLNRKHRFLDVINVTKKLKEIGITNINFDLILGLPNVTDEMLKKDLFNLLSLEPTHISCYSLTVNPHTKFYLDKVETVDENKSYDQYKLISQILKEHSFIHYEVSNWAKQNYESKHNFVYWDNKKYYGLGVSASGYLNNIRYTNTKSINDYINNNNKIEKEIVSKIDEFEYQVMLNLRTIHGIDLNLIKEKFDIDLLIDKKETIEYLINNNYIYRDKNALIPTFKGMMNVDYMAIEIIK